MSFAIGLFLRPACARYEQQLRIWPDGLNLSVRRSYALKRRSFGLGRK
jgi:hypothetical protein